jgi:uncharacterized protein (DUF1778 family)
MHRPNSKTQVVRLRVTPKEKSKIEAQAKKRGETLSDFIRAKTLQD